MQLIEPQRWKQVQPLGLDRFPRFFLHFALLCNAMLCCVLIPSWTRAFCLDRMHIEPNLRFKNTRFWVSKSLCFYKADRARYAFCRDRMLTGKPTASTNFQTFKLSNFQSSPQTFNFYNFHPCKLSNQKKNVTYRVPGTNPEFQLTGWNSGLRFLTLLDWFLLIHPGRENLYIYIYIYYNMLD